MHFVFYGNFPPKKQPYMLKPKPNLVKVGALAEILILKNGRENFVILAKKNMSK